MKLIELLKESLYNNDDIIKDHYKKEIERCFNEVKKYYPEGITIKDASEEFVELTNMEEAQHVFYNFLVKLMNSNLLLKGDKSGDQISDIKDLEREMNDVKKISRQAPLSFSINEINANTTPDQAREKLKSLLLSNKHKFSKIYKDIIDQYLLSDDPNDIVEYTRVVVSQTKDDNKTAKTIWGDQVVRFVTSIAYQTEDNSSRNCANCAKWDPKKRLCKGENYIDWNGNGEIATDFNLKPIPENFFCIWWDGSSNIKEYIDPSEATNDISSIKTIIDGKRNIAFTAEKNNSKGTWKFIQQTIKENDLQVMFVKGNPGNAYIVYKKGSEKDAKKLKDIAEKYDGYLYYAASPEDTREIGRILNYDPKKVEEFIEKNKDK
jgi:hypothetical protein